MQNGFTLFRSLLTRRCGAGLWLMVVLGFAAGCGHGKSPSSLPGGTSGESRQVLSLHWIGKTRLVQDTNAASQMEIWNMPVTADLGKQTLDKLARALPSLVGVPEGSTPPEFNDLIRSLLDDLVEAESFLEVWARTNSPNQYAVAVRLSPERAAFWNTNLATVAEAFVGAKATRTGNGASGWRVSRARPPASVQLALLGDWTVLGVGAQDTTEFASFVRRFDSNSPPATSTGNYWVEFDADLNWLLRLSPSVTTQSLPSVHLTLEGEGQNVRTRGELTFPKPSSLGLPPWNIPTNWIYDPLVNFTAVRGVKSWIESLGLWQNLSAGEAPDQFVFWTLDGVPFRTYMAAPWMESSNRFYTMSHRAMEDLNRSITNEWCEATAMTNANGIIWTCNPFLQAFLRHDSEPTGEFVSGGFFPPAKSNRAIPPELLSQFISKTNLLYYDWEITESRVFGWFQLAAFLRLVSEKAQLDSEAVAVKWLVGISTNLGNAATTMEWVDPTRVSLSRTSSVGLTGLELQLLVNWLESPSFPRSLHTFSAPLDAPPRKKLARSPDTNAPPANGHTNNNRPP